MVRESIFNILGSTVDDRIAYDLFAGTGALGFEALSRGARRCAFVESDRAAIESIKHNIAHLRFEDACSVVPIDVYRWIRGFQPIDPDPFLVFVDPPYQELERHGARFHQLIADFAERLPSDSIVVVESGEALPRDFWPAAGEFDARRYGNTHLTFLTVPHPESNNVDIQT
jgi:16S rRNA (guanine966-N2)-methyltransferase